MIAFIDNTLIAILKINFSWRRNQAPQDSSVKIPPTGFQLFLAWLDGRESPLLGFSNLDIQE